MELKFDLNNHVEMPEIILGRRNYDKLGSIVNIDNLSYEYNLMSADSLCFTVYKELNHEKERLWDEIKERKLIYLKDFHEWFQIDVATNDENGLSKEVTATSLCEAELSQVYIRSAEINTENDIAREAYKNPTVFYKPSAPEESLLHRLLKEAPNYYIKHVDERLWNIQRTFSIDGTSIYDELTGEIAEEIGCLFLFDSTDRSISVYDLETNCNHCGYRGDYTDACPECGSTDLDYGYGNDTTIFVDSETLAESISLSGNQDEVKNYIKICGGDEKIDAAIAACNPAGTQYIYAFSDRDREDMSDALVTKLDEYAVDYKALTPTYQAVMKNIYDAIDEQLKLESAMMPDITTAPTNAEKELAKLTSSNLSPVAVQDVSIASIYTVNNAVLGMAKCVVNSTVFKIEIVDSSFANQTWKGKFKVTNYSDEEDCAENTEYITLTINDDYAYYIEQKIRKTIDRDDIYLVDIFDVKTDLDVFTAELKKYCLSRLKSFESAYQSVIDVLIETNCSNDSTYGDIYTDLYLPYYNKLVAIQEEKNVRIAEIEAVDARLAELEKPRSAITTQLNLQNYLGDALWKELCSFRREDSFENSNYISDGLDNSEIFAKAQELFDKAKDEAVTASTLQMSLSTTMFNLLAIPEFQKLTSMFEGGNWIRVSLDHKIYRLRLIHFKIDFSNIQDIEVEFSDVTQTSNGLNDTKSLMNKVRSMATNFNYVAHQAEQGSKSLAAFNSIKEEGLNTALYNISNSVNQEFLIDEHGITGRQWDDILDNYSPEQVKFTNNCLVYTDDYWQTAKAALGKIEYYNPVLNTTVSQYGLLADAVIAGVLMGNDMIGGNIYSENYSSTAGTHIDLNNGTFSFAGGKLTFNETTLSVCGNINGSNISGSIFKGGSIEIGTGFNVDENGILTANGVSISGSITATSGIIGGCSITNGKLTVPSANISGEITATKVNAATGTIDTVTAANLTVTSGKITLGNTTLSSSGTSTIGGWTIGSSSLYNGTDSMTSTKVGTYIGTDGIRQYASSSASVDIKNGILTAKGADINGSISTSNIIATGGTIGGWTITSTKIYGGDSSTHVAAIQYPRNEITWVFAAGGTSHDAYADCPFRVSKEGKLYTTDITATGGTIGGWSLSASSIYRTSSTFGASNGMYFGINGISIGSGFQVTSNGVVTANTKIQQIYNSDIGTRSVLLQDGILTTYFQSDSACKCILGYQNMQTYGSTIPSYRNGLLIQSPNSEIGLGCAIYTHGEGCLTLHGRLIDQTSGTAIISDMNVKTDISPISEQILDVYDNLTPVQYKLKDGTSERTHTGFIAQELLEAIKNAGLTSTDLAAYVEIQDGEDSICAIRYSELIAIIAAATKRLEKEVKSIKTYLENKI